MVSCQPPHQKNSNDGDVLAPSSGRCLQRRCVVTEVVPEVVEEALPCSINKAAPSVSGGSAQKILPKTEKKIDMDKAEAPSEHFESATVSGSLPADNDVIVEEHTRKNFVLPIGKYRCRTMSDGSQLETHKHGVTTVIQNGLNQFCLSGLLTPQRPSVAVGSALLGCGHSIFQRCNPHSTERAVLQHITESTLVVSDRQLFSELPPKCSSSHSKASAALHWQVECPF